MTLATLFGLTAGSQLRAAEPIVLDTAAVVSEKLPAIEIPGLPLLLANNRSLQTPSWRLPDDFAPGRYIVSFLATDHAQPTPGHQEEHEPYIISRARKGHDDLALFTYVVPGGRSESVTDLPPLYVKPTLLAERRTAGAMHLQPGDALRLDLRRHMLLAGDVRLLPASPADDLELTVQTQTPYHVFSPIAPVQFDVAVRFAGDAPWNGTLEVEWGDAIGGAVRRESHAIDAAAGSTWTQALKADLPNGAYFLRTTLRHEKAGVVASTIRYFVYGPHVEAKDLPEAWPFNFHHSNAWPFVPDVGIKQLRLFHPGWRVMEPQKGQYKWDEMDRMVETLRAKQQTALWVCSSVPRWASSAPPEETNHYRFGSYPPTDMKDLADFLEAFWDRYAPGGQTDIITAIEIMNEPNTNRLLANDYAKYVEFGRVVYEVTKRKAPGVKVVGISMSGGMHNWWAKGVLEAGLGQYMDVASIHIYEVDMPHGSGVSVARKFNEFKQILRNHDLGDMPIWDTEIGYPSDIRRDGVIIPQEQLNHLYAQHPDYKEVVPWVVGRGWRPGAEDLGAAWIVRSSFHKLALGMDKQFLFQWQASSRFSWFYDWREGGNVMPKLILPVHGVMAQMYRKYGGKVEGVVPVEVEDPAWRGYAWRFRGPEGSMIVAHVFPEKADGGGGDPVAAELTIDVADRVEGYQEVDLEKIDRQRLHWWRSEAPGAVRVRIPVNASHVEVADMLDRSRRRLTPEDGAIALPLTEYPVYIIERLP
jgi:hypothetical protein